MKINGGRLRAALEGLGRIGASLEGGVCRYTYSGEYYKGVGFLITLMEEAGMEVRVDTIGNVIGTYPGECDEVLLMGSHIDSVPHAGIFDGCLGVLGAVEAVRTLHDSGAKPHHTIQVAAFAEEEGNTVVGLLGSSAFVGRCDLAADAVEKLSAHGLGEQDVWNAKSPDLGRIRAYLELHIEQGGVLDTRGIDIGVVRGIVGIERHRVTVRGTSNHAGSTPMSLRNDALVAAAPLVAELDRLARGIDPEMVCTVGALTVEPGAYNVIPGRVDLVVETRAIQQQSLDILSRYLENRYPAEQASVEPIFAQPPVPMDEAIRQIIDREANALGLSCLDMNSGAGHDAMLLAEVVPSGMIFVPSKGGISHAPEEWTEWSDVENGANVLLHTLLALDAQSK